MSVYFALIKYIRPREKAKDIKSHDFTRWLAGHSLIRDIVPKVEEALRDAYDKGVLDAFTRDDTDLNN